MRHACRTIKRVLKNNGSREPDFETNETRDYFITTIYIRDDLEKNMSKNKTDKILDYLNQNQYITTNIASNLLELSPQRVRAVLLEMVKKELIVAEGTYKDRKYKLKI